jgi:hypothetical protein
MGLFQGVHEAPEMSFTACLTLPMPDINGDPEPLELLHQDVLAQTDEGPFMSLENYAWNFIMLSQNKANVWHGGLQFLHRRNLIRKIGFVGLTLSYSGFCIVNLPFIAWAINWVTVMVDLPWPFML